MWGSLRPSPYRMGSGSLCRNVTVLTRGCASVGPCAGPDVGNRPLVGHLPRPTRPAPAAAPLLRAVPAAGRPGLRRRVRMSATVSGPGARSGPGWWPSSRSPTSSGCCAFCSVVTPMSSSCPRRSARAGVGSRCGSPRRRRPCRPCPRRGWARWPPTAGSAASAGTARSRSRWSRSTTSIAAYGHAGVLQGRRRGVRGRGAERAEPAGRRPVLRVPAPGPRRRPRGPGRGAAAGPCRVRRYEYNYSPVETHAVRCGRVARCCRVSSGCSTDVRPAGTLRRCVRPAEIPGLTPMRSGDDGELRRPRIRDSLRGVHAMTAELGGQVRRQLTAAAVGQICAAGGAGRRRRGGPGRCAGRHSLRRRPGAPCSPGRSAGPGAWPQPRGRPPGLGPANLVTLTRAVLVGGVTALVVDRFVTGQRSRPACSSSWPPWPCCWTRSTVRWPAGPTR